jgi:hypothetical protein
MAVHSTGNWQTGGYGFGYDVFGTGIGLPDTRRAPSRKGRIPVLFGVGREGVKHKRAARKVPSTAPTSMTALAPHHVVIARQLHGGSGLLRRGGGRVPPANLR